MQAFMKMYFCLHILGKSTLQVFVVELYFTIVSLILISSYRFCIDNGHWAVKQSGCVA